MAVALHDQRRVDDLRHNLPEPPAHDERQRGLRGPALEFLAARRKQAVLVTGISAGEFAVIFDDLNVARRFLANYRILRLNPEIAYTPPL